MKVITCTSHYSKSSSIAFEVGKKMEDSKKRLLFCSSPNFILCFLILLPLVYFTASFKIEQWRDHFIKWGSAEERDLNNETDYQQKQIDFLLRRLVRGDHRIQLEAKGFTCMRDLESNYCVANKAVRFDTSALKMYIPSPNQELQEETMLPYAEKYGLGNVTPVQILHGNITPPACRYSYDEPLILFSSGGFASNFYHDFNDIIIPLFITSRHFQSNVRFIATDFQLWFIKKYSKILTRLSRYEVINASATAATAGVHCFPGAVVGLRYHESLALNANDIPLGNSMFQFKEFLMNSYDLKIKDASQIEQPTLLFISRTKSRVILNQEEVVRLMEELGFRVIVATPNITRDLDKFVHVVNSCSVMVGVHGAGLTHELFLANGALTIQVVLLGLDWPANVFFGKPAQNMGLEYLQYKIEPEESSLYNLYGPKDPVVTDPESVKLKGFQTFKDLYLDRQNATINVERFRKTLEEAMRFIRHSGTR